MVVALSIITARLATKLSLKDAEEHVDLSNLRCPIKDAEDFGAWHFFLVGRLNSAQVVALDPFRSVVRAM